MAHSANSKPLDSGHNFSNLPAANHYYVAYSGGMDSTVLLHALSQVKNLKSQITAIHVNHNVNPQSNDWVAHCQSFCQGLNVPLITASADLSDQSEDACRQARQKVFKTHLKSGDCLLTAHHMNDHVETILFRLLRGTGIKGMTGITATNGIDHYTVHRPLLALPKNSICQYAQLNQLAYIDDTSNHENLYSRNHIRNLLLPHLLHYQPNAQKNIEATANNLTHSLQLLQHLIGDENPLDIDQFKKHKLLTSALYHWLHNLTHKVPNQKRLMQFSHDCLHAAHDKNPELVVENYRLLRWQNKVYALKHENNVKISELEIQLNSAYPRISLHHQDHLSYISEHKTSVSAIVKYQQSHERIKLTENGQHKKVKKLLQQFNVPPWERQKIPYLYIENKLMAVGSEIRSTEFNKFLLEHKAEYLWLSPPFLL